MKKIQFLGATSGEVTGSSYLLTGAAGDTLLIDLGMYQGVPKTQQLNFLPLSFDPSKLTGVLLTHAHLDHCGRLPLLVKNGFTGTIYTTPATRDITYVSLLDCAAIAQNDKSDMVLYTEEEVHQTMACMKSIEYNTPTTIGKFSVVFRDAGHILGSASIEISTKTPRPHTVVFSGDLGNTPQDLIRETYLIDHADAVVMESTYGDSTHPPEDVPGILQKEINAVENTGATLLIPAFSIQRTQELLHRIGHLKADSKVNADTPVFLDSPMAIKVTEIFKNYPQLYNEELSKDTQPFDFPGLKQTETVAESKRILEVPGAKVIISGSGMMSGGRIIYHLKNYISDSATRLLIGGYQAADTLGRIIEEGAKHIRIHDDTVQVNAIITKIESLSSHADQPKLLDWLRHIKGVKKVFLTHGENPQREALAGKIKSEMGIDDVLLPAKDQTCLIDNL